MNLRQTTFAVPVLATSTEGRSALRRSLSSLAEHLGVSVAGLVLSLVSVLLLLLLMRSVTLIRRQGRQLASLESRLHGAQVKRGYSGEALAPLLDHFPVDVGKDGTTTLFVGQPVDYLHFDEEAGITFIEIKSGGSRLSPRQRRLRSLVEDGAVRWRTMNIDQPTDPKC